MPMNEAMKVVSLEKGEPGPWPKEGETIELHCVAQVICEGVAGGHVYQTIIEVAHMPTVNATIHASRFYAGGGGTTGPGVGIPLCACEAVAEALKRIAKEGHQPDAGADD